MIDNTTHIRHYLKTSMFDTKSNWVHCEGLGSYFM